jgi:hypothetical protein
VTAVTDVKIYSNAKEVELLLNGKSQGKRADGSEGDWQQITVASPSLALQQWRAFLFQPQMVRMEVNID